MRKMAMKYIFICDMSYYGCLFLFVLIFQSTVACRNVSVKNKIFGHVENLNFFEGKSQANNLSCSWMIQHEKQGYYVVSLRIIEIEYDRRLWFNELIFKTDRKQIIVDNLHQRMFYIPSSSNLEIDFQTKSHFNSLNIHRFLLEFIYVNKDYNYEDYFRCKTSGLIIPKQWICNCLYECLNDDVSDEENCPICSIRKSSNSLLCLSNEIWCLPRMNPVDSKGVCLPPDQTAQCLYSSKCEIVISYFQNSGEILLDNSLLSNRESLCFIIIAKETYQIKLIINQLNFNYQYPDLEFLVYDGSEEQNQLLLSSDYFLRTQIVQTRQHHIATIVIRKRSIGTTNPLVFHQYDMNKLLLNITWFTNRCPDNQYLCSGHFESKCYSNAQRCDGIWDCISGDDELGCLPSSCPTTFACYNQLRLPSDRPRCYTWFERCNGNSFCPNRTDEQNCTNWWCNSNNGTFLCRNRYCIYEIWVCDGSNDCGDNSDEINCSSRISRRITTATVISVLICCTAFLIALGSACKLFHLRSVEQQASTRLLNPQVYLQPRRSIDSERIAPPSYNQTMGFTNDQEERHAILSEQLRLAGLENFIPLTSRHRHHHEGSGNVLMERHTTNRFDRFRSMFTRNLSINNNSIPPNEIAGTSAVPPIVSCHESHELPPAYSEEQFSSPPVETDEQANSDTDDDDKMLLP